MGKEEGGGGGQGKRRKGIGRREGGGGRQREWLEDFNEHLRQVAVMRFDYNP